MSHDATESQQALPLDLALGSGSSHGTGTAHHNAAFSNKQIMSLLLEPYFRDSLRLKTNIVVPVDYNICLTEQNVYKLSKSPTED